jgi:predicted membrane chloride channel (bestrophin family)
VFVFLVTLPFGILTSLDWLTPVVTMLVAYPILALDEIGVQLQNPFSTAHLNHLPLDEICRGLERNLLALLSSPPSPVMFAETETTSGETGRPARFGTDRNPADA